MVFTFSKKDFRIRGVVCESSGLMKVIDTKCQTSDFVFSKEIRKLKLDIEELQAELDEFYNKDKSRTLRAGSRAGSRRSSAKSSPVRSRAG